KLLGTDATQVLSGLSTLSPWALSSWTLKSPLRHLSRSAFLTQSSGGAPRVRGPYYQATNDELRVDCLDWRSRLASASGDVCIPRSRDPQGDLDSRSRTGAGVHELRADHQYTGLTLCRTKE